MPWQDGHITDAVRSLASLRWAHMVMRPHTEDEFTMDEGRHWGINGLESLYWNIRNSKDSVQKSSYLVYR